MNNHARASCQSNQNTPDHSKTDDFWFRSFCPPTENLFGYRIDTYGGVVFQSPALLHDIPEFRNKLSNSLQWLVKKGHDRGFWIKLSSDSIDHAYLCIKEFGFYIHHANREYVMLAKWMDRSRPDPIPPASSHQVGVGCVIKRSDGCVLLVKEKSGPASIGGIWKLPTGLMESSEDIPTASIRETREETGLDCHFLGILAFRHSQGGNPVLGCSSDVFFLCLLSPTDDARNLVLQEAEILEAQWVHHMDLHSVTKCAEGTAAKGLMERVRSVVAGKCNILISGEKLPAWRRDNLEQWIYYPIGQNNM